MPFSGWLLRLARNVALDHLRRRRATPTEEVLGADTHVDEDALRPRPRLHAALASLPDEQRDVVVMRHVVGLTPPEIAERMGRSESSIHGLHHRGRRALQQELRRLNSAPSPSPPSAERDVQRHRNDGAVRTIAVGLGTAPTPANPTSVSSRRSRSRGSTTPTRSCSRS